MCWQKAFEHSFAIHTYLKPPTLKKKTYCQNKNCQSELGGTESYGRELFAIIVLTEAMTFTYSKGSHMGQFVKQNPLIISNMGGICNSTVSLGTKLEQGSWASTPLPHLPLKEPPRFFWSIQALAFSRFLFWTKCSSKTLA